MARSSALRVPYDIRPSKQIERRLLIDIISYANRFGIPTSSMTYVGMGGIKFFDFVMFHRYLHIKNMHSIEHDRDMFARCKYNVPFGFIDLFQGAFSEFIPEISDGVPYVFWLDYDWGISGDTQTDIVDLGASCPRNSFVFITVKAEPSGPYKDMTVEERVSDFQEVFGEFSEGLTERDLTNTKFRFTTAKLIGSLINYSFSSRTDGVFTPLIRVFYRDSSWMVTIGGFFGEPMVGAGIVDIIKSDMPFIDPTQPDVFELPQINITEPERKLLDLYATTSNPSAGLKRQLAQLGFSSADLKEYRDYFKFLPKYFETYI